MVYAGNVENPAYEQTPVPSITNTRESEELSNVAISDGADNRFSSLSITATPSPCYKPLGDPNYDIIPGEGPYNGLPPTVISIASSTLRSEADQNFSGLSIDLGESLSSYNNEPNYDVIPAEGTYKIPPPPVLAVPFVTYNTPRSCTLKSENHRFSTYSDPLHTERRRSNTLPGGVLRSESFKLQPSGLTSSTLRSESAYSNVSSNASQSQHYKQLSIASNTLESEGSNVLVFRCECGRSSTLSSEACNSFTAMSAGEKELPSPFNNPHDNHKYDTVPKEGTYDVLAPVPPHNGYEDYDIPRKANNCTH